MPDNRWITITPCWVDQRSRVKGNTPAARMGEKDWRLMSTPQLLDMPIFLIPHQGDPVALPMKRKKCARHLCTLARSIPAGRWQRQRKQMPEIWWLSKDGRTESIPIPHTGYATASFYPVKPGVLMLERIDTA